MHTKKTLLELARETAEPAALPRCLVRGVAVLAAALGGLGLVMWIAANWETLGRFGRFGLLQALVLVAGVGAAARPAARAPLGLLALLGIGALFAYFGQTYQTGADAWQLFALWAALALPLCWGVRSDVLWAPWVLVVMTAIALWTHTHSGHRWSVEPQQLSVHLVAWVAALTLVGMVSPALQRYSGAGVWAYRSAVVLTVMAFTGSALGALFHKTVGPHYALGVLLLGCSAAVLSLRRTFDVMALSAVALGLNALLVCGLARWLGDNAPDGDWIGRLFLIGLFAAGLLSASVSVIVKMGRRYAAVPGAALQATVATGLLQANAALPTGTERPWPVVLLTAVGAWFAAVPLLAMVGMLLGDVLQHGAGAYLVGLLVLVGAVVVMRSKEVALFVEQLAVPALLVGGGTLGMGVYRDLHTAGGSWVMLVVVLVLAVAIPKNWLRALAGSLAAVLLAVALLPDWGWLRGRDSLLMVLHGLLALWLVALWWQERAGAALAACVEPMAAGWLLATLAGLVWLSGATFLVGGAVGSNEVSEVLGWIGGHGPKAWQTYAIQAGASVLVLVAAAVGGLAWPTLRQFFPLAVALVLTGLAWFMPLLGAVVLALMVCATTRRWRLAAACALAVAWIVGSFYYQLQWPLADKALVLVGAAVVLGVLAWWESRQSGSAADRAHGGIAGGGSGAAQWVLMGGTALTVLVANVAIWQKQELIAHGHPLYLALAPVDPRSLMEGDYMRLRFPTVDAHDVPLLQGLGSKRPRMVVQLDARAVATVQRLHAEGEPLAANERLLELTPKDGSWVVVTDAWFFKEGDVQRWEQARFGEFRVVPDGRALLVGMADANLQPIAP